MAIDGNYGDYRDYRRYIFGGKNKKIDSTKTPESKVENKVSTKKLEETKSFNEEDLLTSSFYPDVKFSKNINIAKNDPASLDNLQGKRDIVLSENVSQKDVLASLELNDLVKGNEYDKLFIGLSTLDTYRGYTEKYGKLQTPDKESGIKPTAEVTLNIVDDIDSIVSFA